MKNKKTHIPDLHPISGIRLAVGCAGIKKPGRPDVVVFELCETAQVSAVFTQNAFWAAPVTVAKRHLAAQRPRYLLINTGNANAGTGDQGVQDALACCGTLAELTDCTPEQILPFSTGVIGENLPVESICTVLPSMVNNLKTTSWVDAAWGILTTDTVPKALSRQLDIGGHKVTITGIAKGSGMICPDMATMLAYIATDAGFDPGVQQQCLKHAVDHSFNRITVDGDTSTNDACLLIATGNSSLPIIADTAGGRYHQLSAAIDALCEDLAKAMIRDGEGATKLVTVEVKEAQSEVEGNRVVYAIAHSPLVKTALFAGDPNWGRILAAVGRCDIKDLDISRISIYLDDVCIVRHGERAGDYLDGAGRAVMEKDEITIRVALGRGTAQTRVWTCDLSYDYVRINAEYRT